MCDRPNAPPPITVAGPGAHVSSSGVEGATAPDDSLGSIGTSGIRRTEARVGSGVAAGGHVGLMTEVRIERRVVLLGLLIISRSRVARTPCHMPCCLDQWRQVRVLLHEGRTA